jgi:hypothetical protein
MGSDANEAIPGLLFHERIGLAQDSRKSAIRSPMTTVDAMVFPVDTLGMTEASAIDSPSTPRT